jgi:hypothetical protein
MTQRERTDQIAGEAAEAARLAADQASNPEARFFLRQHALLLERLAGRRRAADRASARAACDRPAPGALRALDGSTI